MKATMLCTLCIAYLLGLHVITSESSQQASICQKFLPSIVNSATNNIRGAVRSTKIASDFVANGNERTRGIPGISWIFSCFNLFKKQSKIEPKDVFLEITNTSEFESKVMRSQKPVLVVYTYKGCVTCPELSKEVGKYMLDLKGKALHALVDAETIKIPDKETLRQYPAVQVFQNEKKMSARLGYENCATGYKDLLKPYLKK